MGEWNHSSICVCDCMCRGCTQVTASQELRVSMLFVLPPRSSRRPQRFSIWHIEPSLFGEKNFRSLGLPGSNSNQKKRGKLHLQFMIKGWSIFHGFYSPRKLLCTLKNGGSKTALQLKCLRTVGENSFVFRGVMVSLQFVGREWCRFWRLKKETPRATIQPRG